MGEKVFFVKIGDFFRVDDVNLVIFVFFDRKD